MPFLTSPIFPGGKLDTDSDLSRVAPNDYVNALNITHFTNSGQTTQTIQNVLGNNLEFNIPATVQQNKTYRIGGYGLAGGGVSHTLRFFFTNGSMMSTAIWAEGGTKTATVANAKASITANLAAATPTQTVTYTDSPDGLHTYFELTITTVLGYEYSVQNITNTPSTALLTVDITKEAIDLSLAGEANIIGSGDLLGDLFIWSTSQTELPSVVDTEIVSATNNGSGRIRIIVTNPHRLATGESIKLLGINGAIEANGTWIVVVVSPTVFDLQNSVFTLPFTPSPNFTLTINNQGIGEIGVATYDPNTDVTTYTRLIKSKEFNFVRKKQIDTWVEKDSIKKSLYWTDDYNPVRVLYYYGPYIQDGALTVYNINGRYSFGTINSETILELSSSGARLTFTDQLQSGGAVKSGNWRYTIRFLTDSFSPTSWLDLSNPINVYKSPASVGGGSAQAGSISGDLSDVITPKINEFDVVGIIPGIFKYVELAAVNYVDDAIVGYILKRVVLSPTDTSKHLQHTGTETGVTDLDLGTLNATTTSYATAKNIRALDNRLVISNLTARAVGDFQSWAQTFQHKVKRDREISNVGMATTVTYKLGEFADPVNVYNSVGYTQNETYRFGVKVRFKAGGGWSQVFHVDDVVINCSATNTNSNGTLLSTRRFPIFGALLDYDLTSVASSSSTYNVVINYVEFGNIDLDFLIDGSRVRDLIDAFSFERVELSNTNRTILASGMIVLGVHDRVLPGAEAIGKLSDGQNIGYSDAGGTKRTGEYPGISGLDNGAVQTYPTLGAGAGLESRNFLSFYSPDLLFNNTDIQFNAGDRLITYGNPWLDSGAFINGTSGGHHYSSYLAQYNGSTSIGITPTNPATGLHIINELRDINYGSEATFTSGPTIYTKRLQAYAPLTDTSWATYSSLVINTATNVQDNGITNDAGFYIAQYYRSLVDQYGDIALSKYIPTGNLYEIISTSPTIIGTDLGSNNGVDVLGGDTFTQKSFLKYRFPNSSSDYGVEGLGWGGGLGFYSQNKVNTQMAKKYENTSILWEYPGVPTSDWLELSTAPTAKVTFPVYNNGYNIKNGINSDVGFDVNATQVTDMPTRIAYSDLKPQNSLVDNYRILLPLNFRDLDIGDGEIVHHDIVNSELVTWQLRKIQRQFFNTTSELQNSNTAIIIGDGGVLSRKGQTLTVIGCNNKWSIIRGKSVQGNDTYYWIDTELRKDMRMGYDGTVSLGDVRGMESFWANNLTWVENKDTPADGEGICGVWDDRKSEVIWSVRGKRVINSYNPTLPYVSGNVIAFTPTTFSTFEKTGEFYRANQAVLAGQSPVTTPAKWDLIPHTDINYYNEYNLAFNEKKNGFSSFYSFLPKIFLKWKNTFFSPRPISDTGNVYLNNKGHFCIWYHQTNDVVTQEQKVDGSITMVFNKDVNAVWRYLALLFNTEIVPFRIDIETQNHKTFMIAADCEEEINEFLVAIKNDILTSSNGLINDEDTSSPWGGYVSIKLTYEADVFQKMIDCVLKVNQLNRSYNK